MAKQLNKLERETCKALAWEIAHAWKEEDGLMSATAIRGKLVDPRINPNHKRVVLIGTLKTYLKEGGIKYADSQEIEKDRWDKVTKAKREDRTTLQKDCEDLIEKLNEKLETGQSDIDDLSRDMVARLYIISKLYMEMAVKDGSITVLKEAIKCYKDACNSTLSTRIINNKPSSIVQENEGISRILDRYKSKSSKKIEDGMDITPIDITKAAV